MNKPEDIIARMRAGMSTDEDANKVQRMVDYMRVREKIVDTHMTAAILFLIITNVLIALLVSWG